MPDPGGAFTAARKSTFRTPLSHWALTWPEYRHLPEAWRDRAAKLTAGALVKEIEIPGGFSFAPTLTWRQTSRATEAMHRARWLAFPAGFPEPVAWNDLAEHFEQPNALRVHLPSASEVNYVLLLTRAGQPLAYASREVDLGALEAHHGFITVARGLKGSGVASQVLANAMTLYRQLGVRRILLTAGLTGGGSFWPIYGFQPVNAAEWSQVKRTIRANLKTLAAGAKGAYPGGELALMDHLGDILADTNPDAIWNVVDLDPGGAARKAGRLPHGLGAWLLQGSRWKGILDLDNPDAEQRARKALQNRMARGEISKPTKW